MNLIDDILKLFVGRGEELLGKDYLAAEGGKIISLCPLPIVVCNKKFSIVAANPAFARFFKIPAEKLKERTLFQILGNNKVTLTADGKDYQQITRLSTVVGDRNPKILQGEFPGIGKRVFHVFTRMFQPNVLLLFQDVTEAKALEDKISKSRHELLSIFDGVDDPMVMINKDLKIRRINNSMLKVLGGTNYRTFIGRACYYKLHGLTDRCPGCTADKTFTTGKKTSQMGLLQARKNADDFTYQVTCYPLKDASGKVTGIAESYKDTTEMVQVEDELHQSERNRMVESLAAGVAHEVRNPLAVIRSTAQYCLGEVGENQDLKESLQAIMKSSETANKVVSSLLDFSRPKEVQYKRQGLRPLLEKAIGLVKGRAATQKVRLQRSIPGRLPSLVLDRSRFYQAILNLFINSLDAMPRGGTLGVEVRYRPGNSKVTVFIRDSGTGIPEEMVPKIFQPFYTTKKDGVGLGLPIAEGIIRAHGGKVRFRSWSGKGTEVRIELPTSKKPITLHSLKEHAGGEK